MYLYHVGGFSRGVGSGEMEGDLWNLSPGRQMV